MSAGINADLRASVKEALVCLVYCPSCQADALFAAIPWFCDTCWPDCIHCGNSKTLAVRRGDGLEQPASFLLCGQCYNVLKPDEAAGWAREFIGYDSEAEARLMWALSSYHKAPGIRPIFPGDKPAPIVYKGAKGASPFETIKAAVTVADFAARFTTLRSASKGNLKGCCPIHIENTPSFYVYTATNTWRCFGACATGGDVIALVQALSDKGALV